MTRICSSFFMGSLQRENSRLRVRRGVRARRPNDRRRKTLGVEVAQAAVVGAESLHFDSLEQGNQQSTRYHMIGELELALGVLVFALDERVAAVQGTVGVLHPPHVGGRAAKFGLAADIVILAHPAFIG